MRFEKINHALVMADRERVESQLDSQGVKTTEPSGSPGYDAGKKIRLWSTPMAVGSYCKRIPPAFRIAMGVDLVATRQLAKDFEATPRLRQSLPLCRICHAALTPPREVRMSFETDS
jgi:hypothetical protein